MLRASITIYNGTFQDFIGQATDKCIHLRAHRIRVQTLPTHLLHC